MNIKRYLLKPMLVLLFATSSALLQAANEISQLVPFQGRLHNSEGSVVSDGVYDLTFSIYSTATGGEADWSEPHSDVSVIHGYINVLLGALNAFSEKGVDFTTQKYLSIAINGGQEMFPRHQLVPSFHSYNANQLGGKDADTYAQIEYVSKEISDVEDTINGIESNVNKVVGDRFVDSGNTAKNADKLDGLTSDDYMRSFHSGDLVPVGSVLIWPVSNNIPTGYLECNGEALVALNYPELYAAIGSTYGGNSSVFHIPDFRGYFLRGLDRGRNIDEEGSSRQIGTPQDSQNKSHTHEVLLGNSDSSGNVIEHGANRGSNKDNTQAQGGAEARPQNMAVVYIIKAFAHTQ